MPSLSFAVATRGSGIAERRKENTSFSLLNPASADRAFSQPGAISAPMVKWHHGYFSLCLGITTAWAFLGLNLAPPSLPGPSRLLNIPGMGQSLTWGQGERGGAPKDEKEAIRAMIKDQERGSPGSTRRTSRYLQVAEQLPGRRLARMAQGTLLFRKFVVILGRRQKIGLFRQRECRTDGAAGLSSRGEESRLSGAEALEERQFTLSIRSFVGADEPSSSF